MNKSNLCTWFFGVSVGAVGSSIHALSRTNQHANQINTLVETNQRSLQLLDENTQLLAKCTQLVKDGTRDSRNAYANGLSSGYALAVHSSDRFIQTGAGPRSHWSAQQQEDAQLIAARVTQITDAGNVVNDVESK